MTGAIGLGHVAIVLRTLVHVLDHQADRRSRRASDTIWALEHAREDAHLVRLLPLRGKARLAGAARVEERLDLRLADGKAGRAAVDHRANRGPVAFAPGGETEEVTEAVQAHGMALCRRCAEKSTFRRAGPRAIACP